MELIGDYPRDKELFDALLKLSKHSDASLSGKASWIVRSWLEQQPSVLKDALPHLLKILCNPKLSDPAARNLSGCLVDTPPPKSYDAKILTMGIALLKQTHRAPAVYANVLRILKPITERYPETLQEIRLLTELLPCRAQACIFVAGRYLQSELINTSFQHKRAHR